MDFPKQLGPYRLVRRLGAGGMAEVFLATAYGASGFEKRVAIKLPLPEHRGDATSERALIDEACVAARLTHPNLVQVHDLGAAAGTYYVRMDYVDGIDLAAALERAQPSVPLALFVAHEIASGLAAVHGATDDAGRPLGLVHRDVSPSNVLLSRSGDVKLSDFGIAKATMLADQTQGGVRKGKYAYMSPEQIAHEPLGPASDQFALGIVLAEMLTGARPFDGDGPLDTMERIREAKPPTLGAQDDDVRAIVMRALSRRPEDRFASTEALADALESARTARQRAGRRDVAEWVERACESVPSAVNGIQNL